MAQTDAQEFQLIRATIIDLIMATDMKSHFSLVSRLQARVHALLVLHQSVVRQLVNSKAGHLQQ